MNSMRLFALVVILLGVVFLLDNLGLAALSPTEIIRTYWPVLLIVWGVRLLLSLFRMTRAGRIIRPNSFFSPLILTGLGGFLLANNLNWIEIEIRSVWGIIWPVLLIYIGLQFFSGSRRSFMVFDEDGGFSGRLHRPGRKSGPGSGGSRPFRMVENVSTMVGELHLGDKAFELKDMHYDLMVGDLHIDLTRALIPERQVTIDLNGWVGDIEILVPADLPVAVYARVSIGDIELMGNNVAGMGRSISFQSPGFDDASRRVRIFLELKVGSISVRSV